MMLASTTSASDLTPLATGASGSEMLTFFLLFVVAAALALVGFYVAVAVRRWSQRDQAVANFTFQDLRDMKARGEITEQEFKAMRSVVLAQVKAAADAAPPEAAPPDGGSEPDERPDDGGEPPSAAPPDA